MKVVLVSHPQGFLGSQSMPKVVDMIGAGMRQRGHVVEVWRAKPVLQRLATNRAMAKWLGYIDQFILFSVWMSWRVLRERTDTVFVFSDQALGPWVLPVSHRPNVVHLNDFLAIRSALGEFPQNRTGWSGRIYQSIIRHGLRRGQHFVAISHKTRDDLLRLVCGDASRSQVIHLGLNFPYRPLQMTEVVATLRELQIPEPAQARYVLHVGGNQWYKNRRGVLALYAQHVRRYGSGLALWVVGGKPDAEALASAAAIAASGGNVRFFSGVSDEQLCALYSGASAMLFPSIAEGFGWPIAEAMACGCPVITTDDQPMREVGGAWAFYIPRLEAAETINAWAIVGAHGLESVLQLSADERESRVQHGLLWVRQFATAAVLDEYERVYAAALSRRKAGEAVA